MNSKQEQLLKLKNAELEKQLAKKNRDLEIEAALEKVRSCSLAMHKSDELDQVVAVVADKLRELGVVMEGAVICTPANEGQGMMMWSAMAAHMNAPPLYVPFGHPLINEWGQAWKRGDNYMGKLWTYEEKVDFWEWAFEHSDFKYLPEFRKEQIRQGTAYALSAAFQKNSSIAIPSHTGQILSETHAEILKRFSKVFEQAYIRFLDLKKSEAQTREAEIQLALERVRARTMAMQHSSELKDAASILFQQVELLGVTTWTSGFQLWDENRKAVTVWTCTAGVVQQAFRLPADDDLDSFMMQVINAEQNGEDLYVEELSGKVLKNHYSYMAALPGLADNFKSLSDAGIALPLSQVNHAAFFSYGYLLFITYEPMPRAHDIFIRFAKVFDQTYTRFLDLQKSEALALRAKEDLILLQTEKKRAEDALTELKATQAQLVQREKMASLGELTAGIAHEIQNPLNFVNNFSEVSAELIDEMEEELAKGDTEEARTIAADVKQNLEKIRHHGKRADGIVKGMLEHSRASTGQKEPTDMNQLADEYLRLAYHGLRAKDKSFNAGLITNYDEHLPKVNVIPQDIGRVMLNLFTNAFYAVNQKQKTAGPDYKPEVSVTTSTENGQVIIKIKDNGIGIPDAIKDKIMQPFFTTKPTGEGTGLGLSLTYDIVVKAHGGKINIESKDGEGSEFIIDLPLT